jgi:hypothetical protein
MIKTLVIHPDDRSTDFLKPIYQHLDDATILTGGKAQNEVRELIEQHDQVIMLGHGSPNGLFSCGQFYMGNGMIIDHSMVAALGNKKNNIYIWCNADAFVSRYYLRGFYTGMFISEYSEAAFCKVPTFIDEIEQSNALFANIVGQSVLMEAKNIQANTKLLYHLPHSEVNKYNNNRLYYR